MGGPLQTARQMAGVAACLSARGAARRVGRGTSLALLALTAALALAYSGCAPGTGDVVGAHRSLDSDDDRVSRVSLAFAGDVLPHLSVVRSARGAGGAYDFGGVFAPVAPYLQDADLAAANLETRFAGSSWGYQGYPRFNSPDELAEGLSRSGVDLVGTANNHALDMGFAGVVRTLTVLEAAGLGHAGTARSAVEHADPRVRDVRGVRVAVLNYTEHTNGVPLPGGRSWAVDLLDVASVAAEAARARAAGAELVIGFVHWGNEYTRYPSADQRTLAPRLLDAGLDAIVGSGPHMVQPVEWVQTPSGRAGLVAWSLGNFVSGQRLRGEDSGIVLYVDVVDDERGARVAGARYLPVYVQKAGAVGAGTFRVLPAHPDLTPVSDAGLSADDRARLEHVYEELVARLDGTSGVSLYRPPPGP